MVEPEKIKYPSGEIVWVGYRNKAGDLMFIVTSKAARDNYFLYERDGGSFKKLGKGADPAELVRKFGVRERLAC